MLPARAKAAAHLPKLGAERKACKIHSSRAPFRDLALPIEHTKLCATMDHARVKPAVTARPAQEHREALAGIESRVTERALDHVALLCLRNRQIFRDHLDRTQQSLDRRCLRILGLGVALAPLLCLRAGPRRGEYAAGDGQLRVATRLGRSGVATWTAFARSPA